MVKRPWAGCLPWPLQFPTGKGGMDVVLARRANVNWPWLPRALAAAVDDTASAPI